MVLTRSYVIAATVIGVVSWLITAIYLPSIRWAPLAFTLGALFTLAGIVYLTLTTSRPPKHDDRETPRRIAQLAFTANNGAWQHEKEILASRAEYRRPTIFPQVEKFSKALDGLLDLLLQEFITSWFRIISPRPLFQHEIDRAIRSAVLTIVARAAGKDLVVEGVSRLLPIITGHLSSFYDAERSVRGKRLDYTVTEGDELDTAIAGRYRNGRLHHVAALEHMDTAAVQQEHLRSLIAKLLPLVLPQNMTTSEVVSVMAREIVACAVLTPLLTLLEDPDTWNQLVITFAGPMLQDRKTVRRVRAALDEHAPTSPKTIRTALLPRLRPYDNERQFEKFIRAIRQITNLSDARRCRSDLLSQIRKDSALDGQDAIYMRRLETGQRLLDQKIASLATTKPTLNLATSEENPDKRREASLEDVLTDAAGLSYFMEYMDRLRLVQLVQFWLVVSGFRNPLEGDLDEPSVQAITAPDRMDIAQMYEGYLIRPELRATESTLTTAQQYIKAGKAATSQQYVLARRAVLQTQTAVHERMRKQHFDSFKSSDLYYKWLAIDRSTTNTAHPPIKTSSPPSSPTHPPRSSSATRRPQLTSANRESELRRAVLSSADLKGYKRGEEAQDGVRRSLDSINRPSLFGDEDRMTDSISSLHSVDSDGEAAIDAQAEAKAVDAMQLALDNIVGEEATIQTVQSSDVLESVPSTRKPHSNRPNLSSLGLVGHPSGHGVFVDDLFNDETPKFAEDEYDESESAGVSDDDTIEQAAPGDLGLAEAIGALNADVERLNGQKHILESLKAKAELTNNVAELRILNKSEQSLLREIRRKEIQKQQWTVQESDNSLYGRAQVTIKSVMVGHESDGKEYALYVIEVRRQAGENMVAATWAVTRRYSQFHDLHKRLRARFPVVRSINFPRRQALFTLQKDFLERRRLTLEQYLRSLLLVPAICRSRELRAFLSQSSITPTGTSEANVQAEARDFVSRIYNSVSDGMEEFLGNIPVLDSLSLAGQNLISAAAASHGSGSNAAIDALDPATHDPATAAEAEAELNAYEAKEDEPFVKPICDLFLETFELSKGSSWLRGRTVVVVLHQLLGGTIERKVREGADAALEDDSLVGYINMLKQAMWPDGKARGPSVPRTLAEKTRARKEAALLLDSLLPDLAGSVVGKSKARAASRKIVAVLNNKRLNTHLILTIFDEMVKTFFPEVSH